MASAAAWRGSGLASAAASAPPRSNLRAAMRLGYNTNGLAHHELFDAVELLAEIGYRSVAITIDHGVLAPYERYAAQRAERLRHTLERLQMCSVVETGARFLLDPRHKHEPTLVSADPEGRARRVAFYKYAIRCAATLGSDCVSIWSGAVRDGAPFDVVMARLVEGLDDVLAFAAEHKVPIGFEPEPGMFIDSMAAFGKLMARLGWGDLRLTLDIGHAHCQGEGPLGALVRRWGGRLVNVHLEDMRRGVHEHLMFGEGEIDFLPVLRALREIEYQGGVHVELSRHSHEGPAAARRAYEFLTELFERASDA